MRTIAMLVAAVFVFGACGETDTGPQAQDTPAPTVSEIACELEDGGRDDFETTTSPDDVALLADIAVEAEDCPQVAFTFENTMPNHRVSYAEPPFIHCGSGDEVDTSGWGADAYLSVHLEPASGVDLSGAEFRETYEGEADIDVGGDLLRRVYRTCDFEATMEWLVALSGARDFVASSTDTELVLDIEEARSD